MKKKSFLVFSAFVFSLSVSAQKDAPVAGNAATLCDLLKKDYNSIDPDSRPEEIIKDRSTVISLFKSYLTETNQAALGNFVSKNVDSAKRLMDTLMIWKSTKAAYATVTINNKDANEAQAYLNSLKELAETLKSVEKKYNNFKYLADTVELHAISAQYIGNIALISMIAKFKEKYKLIQDNAYDKYASSNSTSTVQKGIPFIGGDMGFETLIDGFSRFLAKRIKEELTTYVIERVKKWLKDPAPDDPLAELKVLLPRTTGYIAGFQADQVTNFTNEIRQYIQDDLGKMLDNAGHLRETPRLSALLRNNPDLDFAFEAVELIPTLSKLKHPVDYFTFLENSRNISRWKSDSRDAVRYNIANSIYLTGLLSRSLLIVDNGELKFAGVDFITSYASENNFFKLYTGFLYQQNMKYYDIRFAGLSQDSFTTLFQNIINPSGNVIPGTVNESDKYFFKTLLTDV